MFSQHCPGVSAAINPEPKKKPEPRPISPDAEVVSVSQCCRAFCIGRSKLYELLRDGALPSFKVGKKRLIRLATARVFFGGQAA